MERLTRHHDQPKRQELYDRLAEYEDLDLTPEEIVELTGCLPALPKRLGPAPDAPKPKPAGPPVILISDAAKLMSEALGAKPCQLANVFPGLSRRLPLRCRYNTERCDGRSAAECWAWLLQHPLDLNE